MKKTIHSEAQQKFCESLRAHRKGEGLTQMEVAKRLKTPQSVIAKIERGERRLDVVEFLEYAEAVGFNPEKFIRSLRRACAASA